MTWHEVNSMKPGTRVIAKRKLWSAEHEYLLERTAGDGWMFRDVSNGEVWDADYGNDSSFKPTPRGWNRNNVKYELVIREGRNRL